MADVALCFCAADRGHFNWSLPLAEALVDPNVLEESAVRRVEYWTSDESQLWLRDAALPPAVSLGGSTGSFHETKRLVEIFTELSSSGETDKDGTKALEEHFEAEIRSRGVAQSLEEAFGKIPPAQEVQDRVSRRLRAGDVAIVIYEETWCSWIEALAQQAKVPALSFMPSYIDVFRRSAGCNPRAFQGNFNFGPEGMVYTLASCLRPTAPVPDGRRAVGAMLPLDMKRRSQLEDKELVNWLSSEAKPVVYCSLGSHMLSRVLEPGSLTKLVQGILKADCRVLFVLSKAAREFADADPDFLEVTNTSAVKLVPWVNQLAVLAHPSTILFLSHCGANSLHEALACGLPILAMPFFDDQHYNAEALQNRGCAQRLQKRPVNSAQVTAATNALRSPEAKAAAEELQRELLAEQGTLSAAKWVQHVMDEGRP